MYQQSPKSSQVATNKQVSIAPVLHKMI